MKEDLMSKYMNLILYTENDTTIKKSLQDLSYNFIRSHHYFIFHLARTLNCIDILDSKVSNDVPVIEGSELYYTNLEFPEYTLKSAKVTDYDNSLGVIFHCSLTQDNYQELYNFIYKCRYITYYNSDKDLHKGFFIKSMFLKFLRDNPEDPLTKLFKLKCRFMLTGYSYMKDLMESEFDIKTYYVPQLINPNIPEFKSEKLYDGFLINTNKMHKGIVEALDFKILSLVKSEEFIPNHDCIACDGNGMHLDILLSAVSMCKYYMCTYLFQMDSDPYMRSKISSHNLTSKYFECYYANTYPLSSLKTLYNIRDIMSTDYYKEGLPKFKKWMKDNFSISKYKNILIEIRDEINKIK